MSFTIKELHTHSDDDIIALHDKAAERTVVGTAYYRDELHRREQMRAIEASNRLAQRSFWLSISNTLFALVAATAAVLALLD